MPATVLGTAIADIGLLTGILPDHIASGYYDPRKFILPVRVNTLADQSVSIHLRAVEQRVNNSAVTCTGVQASNGIVWINDSVLMLSS